MKEPIAEPMMNLKDIAEAFSALCPACEKAVREKLLQCLAQKRRATPQGLSALRRKVADAQGIDKSVMLDRSQSPYCVRARREFCRRARLEGYSLNEIGSAINRHHTSVLFLIRTSGRRMR